MTRKQIIDFLNDVVADTRMTYERRFEAISLLIELGVL